MKWLHGDVYGPIASLSHQTISVRGSLGQTLLFTVSLSIEDLLNNIHEVPPLHSYPIKFTIYPIKPDYVHETELRSEVNGVQSSFRFSKMTSSVA